MARSHRFAALRDREIFSAAIVRGASRRRAPRPRRAGATHRARTGQLENANRELEAFSYAVSHDLRAPLRGVDGFSRILVEDHAEALPAGRAVLDRIRATSQRMGELIDGLLRLSRIAPPSRSTKGPTSARSAELAASLVAAEPGRRVEFQIEDGLVVDGERRLLTAVMDNLLRNAWKSQAQAQARIEFAASVSAAPAPTSCATTVWDSTLPRPNASSRRSSAARSA